MICAALSREQQSGPNRLISTPSLAKTGAARMDLHNVRTSPGGPCPSCPYQKRRHGPVDRCSAWLLRRRPWIITDVSRRRNRHPRCAFPGRHMRRWKPSMEQFQWNCGKRDRSRTRPVRRQLPIRSVDRYTKKCQSYTSNTRTLMRTNIDIDDKLMRQAIRSSGARTKRAVVEEGLRLLIETRGQRAIRRLRGKVAWEGDLEQSRRGRATK
jgi:Arc/MetJ family transcription regulator